MKSTKTIFGTLLLVLSTLFVKSNEINVKTLLNEMVNRERLTRFPTPYYQSLQASSYNRESVSPNKPGWFADSDGVYCIRTENNNGQKEWVLMEDEGPGVITKIWAVCFYYGLSNTTGANVKIYLDGETNPTINTNFFNLVRGKDFAKVPFADESTRAGNLYFPIPYAKSCKITMDKKVFYNIINYRKYNKDVDIKTFSHSDLNAFQNTIKSVGEQLLNPKVEGNEYKVEKILGKNEQLKIDLPEGGKQISSIEVKFSNVKDIAQALRSSVLIGKFDNKQTVWAPLGDFFNNVEKLHSYKMWEREVKEDGTMICRWSMPYEKDGEIIIKNLWNHKVGVSLKVKVKDYNWKANSMHFYASWRMDAPTPTFPLYDWNFLEATGQGVVVGDQWTVLNPRQGWWGEGDEKIYIDEDFEKNFPSHFGTGTEDYYVWAGGVVPTPADEFSKPFLGNIIVGNPRSMGYNVCTRTRVLDAIPFKKRIKFDVESSCGTRSSSHFLQYAQTTFWYGKPGVRYNRETPNKMMASSKLPRLKDLQEKVKEAKSKIFVVDGAFEAELYRTINKSKTVVEDFAKIPNWGESSNGKIKNLWFENSGDFAELKITEQFEKSKIKLCGSVGKLCGNFEIFVNGKKVKIQDFGSEHNGMTTPLVDLGEHEPVDNAFLIKFIYKASDLFSNKTKNKKALGLDYFLIENNFLNR
jgi:hypothetical protein